MFAGALDVVAELEDAAMLGDARGGRGCCGNRRGCSPELGA